MSDIHARLKDLPEVNARIQLVLENIKELPEIQQAEQLIQELSSEWPGFIEYIELYLDRIIWLANNDGTKKEARIFEVLRQSDKSIYTYIVFLIIENRLRMSSNSTSLSIHFAKAIIYMKSKSDFYDMNLVLVDQMQKVAEEGVNQGVHDDNKIFILNQLKIQESLAEHNARARAKQDALLAEELERKKRLEEIKKQEKIKRDEENERRQKAMAARIAREQQEKEEQIARARQAEIERIERERIEREQIERERAEQQRQEQIRQQHYNNAAEKILLVCAEDFFAVDDAFKAQSVIPQSDLRKIKNTFLRKWFKQHLPPGYTQPDDDQLNAIGSVHGNVQVVARAGSGKTSTLVNRVFFLMKHCRVQANEIMMLAFNRKAANEMRERLLRLLYPKVASEYDTIKAERRATMHRKDIDDVQISLDALTQLRTKHDVGLPFVMTFHGLVHNIANPSETIIYDTRDPEGAIQSKALQTIIDEHIRAQDKVGSDIKQLMLHYFRSEWIDIEENNHGLTQAEFLAYRRSITNISLQGHPVKSHGEKMIADFLFSHDVEYSYEQDVVVDKIRYRPDFTLWKDKKRILIEYIGMKGDADYDELVAQKKEAYKKLKCQYIELTPADVSDETKFRRYMVTLLKSLGIAYQALDDDEIWERIKDRAIGGFSRSMNGFIQKCRQLMLLPTDLDTRMKTHRPLTRNNLEITFAKVARQLYQEYIEYCDAYHLIDFSAIMQRATQMIREGQSDFSKRHSHGSIRQIRFLSIDEFQDFSVMFYELLSAMRGINPTMQLFCVGDDWQAINRFAGADTRYFSEFERYIGPRTLCTITTNYRSAKRIVDMGNALMKKQGGVAAKASQRHVGDIVLVYIDDFVGTEKETEHFGRYGYDIAALSRLVNLHVRQQRNVAVLSRTTAPLEHVFPKISKLFERANTKLVRSTTHGYKGLEQESVILWDVTERQYPMLHPHWIFGRILGDTLEQIIEDERRLFYVGVTRARETLYIVTRRQSMSPFLRALLKTCTVSELAPNNLQVIESLRSGVMLVRLSGKTFDIKDYIKQHGYKWSTTHKVWEKRVDSDEFSEKWLASQAWFSHATSITVTCVYENDDTVLDMYEVESGRINKVKS
jgi:DNA helicase IV